MTFYICPRNYNLMFGAAIVSTVALVCFSAYAWSLSYDVETSRLSPEGAKTGRITSIVFVFFGGAWLLFLCIYYLSKRVIQKKLETTNPFAC